MTFAPVIDIVPQVYCKNSVQEPIKYILLSGAHSKITKNDISTNYL